MAQAGPVKLKVSGSAAKGSGKLNENGVEIKVSGLNASLTGGFASTEAEASFTGAEAKAVLNSDGVQVKTDALDLSGSASLGKNGFEITTDNSATIGIGASVSIVKAEGSVNLGAAAIGIAKLVDAGFSYVGDLWRNGVTF